MEATMDHIETADQLIEYINAIEDGVHIHMTDFRTKSRSITKNDEEHSKVLHCLLNKLSKYYESESCKMLPATKATMLKYTAWTWFG